MRSAYVYLFSTLLLQRGNSSAQGTSGINHVVVNDADLAVNVADKSGDFCLVMTRTALVHDSQVGMKHVGKLLCSLSAANVGAYNAELFGVDILLAEVIGKDRQRRKVINRGIEEALDLALMKVNGNGAVNASSSHDVGNQLSRNRLTCSSLAVLTSIAIARNNGVNGTSRSALCRVGHNKQLHYCFVNVRRGSGLYDEYVCATNTLKITCVNFTVRELLELHVAERGAQRSGNILSQLGTG